MKKASSFVVSLLAIFLFASLVSAYPTIKMTADTELTQQAGTEAEYAVTVTNTGDMLLEEVYLTINFLPSKWYEATENIHLPVGESSVMHYKLTLPADAVGTIKYNVTANAVMGVVVVSQSKAEVTLKVNAPESTATLNQKTSTTIETETTTTIQQNSDKWVLISILVGVGAIFAIAAYVFWSD